MEKPTFREENGEIVPNYNSAGNMPYYPRGDNRDTIMPHDFPIETSGAQPTSSAQEEAMAASEAMRARATENRGGLPLTSEDLRDKSRRAATAFLINNPK